LFLKSVSPTKTTSLQEQRQDEDMELVPDPKVNNLLFAQIGIVDAAIWQKSTEEAQT